MHVHRYVLHGAAAALVVVGLAAQVARPLAPSLGALPAPSRWFDPAYLAQAAEYRRPLYAVALVMLGVRMAVPCLVAFTGRGHRVADRIVERIGPHRPARAAACVVIVVVALTDLALLPLEFWGRYVHEGAFGLRTQGLAGWARDWAVSAGLAWVAVGAATLGGWTLARRLERLWPPVVALGATALTALLMLAAPRVIEPLFFHTRPLEPGPVRTEVEQLLARADLRVDQILVADASRRTTKENAYASGFGTTRQVVLYDTLLAERTPAEVGLVLAHEFGHLRHADDVRGALLGGAGAVALVYGLAALVRWRAATGRQDGQADPRAAAVVVAVAVLAGALGMPLQLAFSRRAEAAADLASLDLTADPATYERVHIDLARANLADPAPPGWVTALWMTHPSTVARLKMGERWPLPAGRVRRGAGSMQ
ncbi:MAG: M48 family metalloprotease [Egibacteraceae bacterium]